MSKRSYGKPYEPYTSRHHRYGSPMKNIGSGCLVVISVGLYIIVGILSTILT